MKNNFTAYDNLWINLLKKKKLLDNREAKDIINSLEKSRKEGGFREKIQIL